MIILVTDPTAIEAAVAAVIAEHGGIDALINNTGATYVGSTAFAGMSLSNLDASVVVGATAGRIN